MQKLILHTQNLRHESMKVMFNHLLFVSTATSINSENNIKNNISECESNDYTTDNIMYNQNKLIICQLCNYKANNLLTMIQHIKSFPHSQMEQNYCLQNDKGNLGPLDLADIFKCLISGE